MKKRPELSELLKQNSGFTLIEILIVLAIGALIMSFVGGNVIRRYDQARVDGTKIQIRQLGVILDDFRRVCGRYPTTEEGLDALIKAPTNLNCKNYDPEGFIKDKRVPDDAWNRAFIYISDGNTYEIKSLGADGKEGGEGVNKDISSKALD
ncbi:type II secretion system protein GspG [bacterium]|jgi:general secretion pathway protein G|nr:type II secretion system protein GspG [bacterium]